MTRLVPRLPKSGFTLMEILVAVAVLSVGTAGIGYAMRAWLHIKERNLKKVTALSEAASLVEELVERPRPCPIPERPYDTLSVTREGVELSVSLERLPGGAPLLWASVRETSGYWNDLNLKRIVKCEEKVLR